MSYIGNQPTSVAFLTDQFSGTGSQTAYTLSAAPANTASILVAVSGVLQDPTTYSTSGLTLTFSSAPPSGTGNISVRYLGIPASNIATTAYRTLTEFTATAGQTTFTPPSYTAGYITVLRNGVQLGTADFTATNGTTVVLATGATAGDLITTISFLVSSVLNAIPAVAGAVTSAYIGPNTVLATNMGSNGTWAPAGTVIQVVNATYTGQTNTSSTTYVTTSRNATITPKFSTSKILILCTAWMYNAGGAGQSKMTMYRNGSAIQPNDCLSETSTSTNTWTYTGFSYVDSPTSTSSLTYELYYKTNTGSVYQGADSCQTSIQLLEIAA